MSIRESEGAKFMQEHIMRDKVESIRGIKIYSISLTLTADDRNQEIEKFYQIGNCRFSSGEALLIWIKLSIMQHTIMNNESKQFRDIFQNRKMFLNAHGGVIASFKYWYISFFPCSREVLLSQDQIKYMTKNRKRNSRTAFYDEARHIIKSDRFRRFSLLMALRTSASETGGRDRNSGKCESRGRSIELQLL
jgi:hypothetical protein